MAPVSLKYVVSFTSQDNCHPVQNLTHSDGFKKWLSDPKDKSGQIEAIFQLDQSYRISYIDIGLIWCGVLEIQVGRSDWPMGRGYQTLLPTASIMSPGDCRLSNNTVRTRMFGPDNLNGEVAKETWDRVRVICRQPWRKDVQYGVSFIRLKSDSPTSADNQRAGKTQSATHKTAKSIQKHFFGKTSSGDNKDQLVTKLLKIAGSTEDGTDKVESLSRTAKLVIAAKDTAVKSMCPTAQNVSPSNRQALYSDSLVTKYGPKFEEEIAEFLTFYKIQTCDLDKITIADIRHKFEKTKNRKLTPEEKKLFIELAREYICMMFTEADNDAEKNPAKTDCSEGKGSNSNHLNRSDHNERKGDNSRTEQNNVSRHTKANSINGVQGKITPKGNVKPTDMPNSVKINERKELFPTPSKPRKPSCIPDQKKLEVRNTALEFKKNGFTSPKSVKILDTDSVDEPLILKQKLVSNFGPSFTHISPTVSNKTPSKQNTFNTCYDSPSTNDTWLSSRSPLETSPPPMSPGVRGRKRAMSGGESRAKIPRTEDNISTPSGRGRKPGRGRGRGKRGGINSREVTPTSFERCASCQETIPEDQLVNHTLICRSSYQVPSAGGAFSGKGNTLGSSQSWSEQPPQSRMGYPDVYISSFSRPMSSGPSMSSGPMSEFSDQYVECPMCNEFFRQCVVEIHAATCCT